MIVPASTFSVALPEPNRMSPVIDGDGAVSAVPVAVTTVALAAAKVALLARVIWSWVTVTGTAPALRSRATAEPVTVAPVTAGLKVALITPRFSMAVIPPC